MLSHSIAYRNPLSVRNKKKQIRSYLLAIYLHKEKYLLLYQNFKFRAFNENFVWVCTITYVKTDEAVMKKNSVRFEYKF